MVMTLEPLREAITRARDWMQGSCKVVYLSPQGQVLTHQAVVDFAGRRENLVLIAGRYEGIDERLLSLEVDEEWSIGDYVLSGGELPAMVLMDALLRQLPGVLGRQASAEEDSFVDGLLDCEHYTRPEVYKGMAVPEVLLSGNHERIRRWRLQRSLLRTQSRRPELLAALQLTEEQVAILAESSKEQV